MKIATWNIERLKHGPDRLGAAVDKIGADILVLTEYDERLRTDYGYGFCTPTPPDIEGTRFGTLRYSPGEHRVCVFTNYRCVRRYGTADEYTSVCVELETERGNLIVYGTIFGAYDVTTVFPLDLKRQLPDVARFSENGNLCVCGDFNCSFAGRCFPSRLGRDTILGAFSENRLAFPTREMTGCVDHIAISESFIGGCDIEIEEWNDDKRLSDHRGVAVTLK
ncbi:MAG: endonuclease/exonuclease/phosphatase family protein [Ruminococcus sp.]|nr:endonuclease/exonuclease/phosphatase family protein [Ruminococcus sp.]MCM1233147.1 endonuclease/exonuclease/phosphatase family protein [Ruminococcus flavefaciens]